MTIFALLILCIVAFFTYQGWSVIANFWYTIFYAIWEFAKGMFGVIMGLFSGISSSFSSSEVPS
jgi:hypothetical protein